MVHKKTGIKLFRFLIAPFLHIIKFNIWRTFLESDISIKIQVFGPLLAVWMRWRVYIYGAGKVVHGGVESFLSVLQMWWQAERVEEAGERSRRSPAVSNESQWALKRLEFALCCFDHWTTKWHPQKEVLWTVIRKREEQKRKEDELGERSNHKWKRRRLKGLQVGVQRVVFSADRQPFYSAVQGTKAEASRRQPGDLKRYWIVVLLLQCWRDSSQAQSSWL